MFRPCLWILPSVRWNSLELAISRKAWRKEKCQTRKGYTKRFDGKNSCKAVDIIKSISRRADFVQCIIVSSRINTSIYITCNMTTPRGKNPREKTACPLFLVRGFHSEIEKSHKKNPRPLWIISIHALFFGEITQSYHTFMHQIWFPPNGKFNDPCTGRHWLTLFFCENLVFLSRNKKTEGTPRTLTTFHGQDPDNPGGMVKTPHSDNYTPVFPNIASRKFLPLKPWQHLPCI